MLAYFEISVILVVEQVSKAECVLNIKGGRSYEYKQIYTEIYSGSE